MTRENYYHWGLANLDLDDEAKAERLDYLEDLTLRLRSLAGEGGFDTITAAVETAVARQTVIDQGIGE